MLLTEQVSAYFKAEGFEDVSFGLLPSEGQHAVVVRPLDMRGATDEKGSLIEILCRSVRTESTAHHEAFEIMEMISDFEGSLVDGGNFITRTLLEHGINCREVDEQDRIVYALRIRMWYL